MNHHHADSTPAGTSYHRGDPHMGDLPHRVHPDPDGRYTVDVHVTPDGRARIGSHTYSPEEFADILRRNGDYDGRPIRLIGCDAGSNDFAHRLSRELDTPVLAPTKPAWTDSHGRVFTSDYEIGPDGKARPKIPPNGEWETHHPDGSTHRAGDDGFTPDTRDADKHHLDPDDATDRGSHDSTEHDNDFRDLRDENRDRRNEGLESVRELTGRNPTTDDVRRPHERALTTARYRSDRGGEHADFYNFSGKSHDWSPAAEAPERPPKPERVFETSDANSYDPETGTWREGDGSNRVHDSEPKLFEDLTRHQLAEYSGLSREEVDDVLRDTNKLVDFVKKNDAEAYRPGFRGEVQRTQDRVNIAIDELNKRAAARAEANGTTYTPFTAADISGDLRMVVDLPSAKLDGTPPEYQVCKSCQKVMIAYQRVFPNMRLEVVNPAGERLFPL